jgi:metallo-beta-lactamase family protein
MMNLRFFGAVRTVTGSCHLIEAGKTRILLDCGLYQGKRKESFERNRNLPFPAESIDLVVLSHAHIDHSGNLPSLVKNGFSGPIWSTRATADLCEWMLRDSASIQEKDVEFVNKKRRGQRKREFEPLYTVADAERTLQRFRGIDYATETEIAKNVTLRFEDAGHILGSASCHLRIVDGGTETIVVFTGDVGRHDRPILRDPVPPHRADILICESTYGGRFHEPQEDVRGRLEKIIGETFHRGGKVLIPAFSVGRTQRIVFELHQLFRSRRLPPAPIFVDSPLSANVTNVFRDHTDSFDEEAIAFAKREGDPFGFERLTYIREVEASKALNFLPVPCVIISASGMCEAGRVLHHLQRIAPDPKNSILIVGFQAEHTLGRRISERAPFIKIYGDEFPLRAQVESISGLSAHADHGELLEYLGRLDRPPRETFLVHGELESAEAVAVALRQRGFPRVTVPEPGLVYPM